MKPFCKIKRALEKMKALLHPRKHCPECKGEVKINEHGCAECVDPDCAWRDSDWL